MYEAAFFICNYLIKTMFYLIGIKNSINYFSQNILMYFFSSKNQWERKVLNFGWIMLFTFFHVKWVSIVVAYPL